MYIHVCHSTFNIIDHVQMHYTSTLSEGADLKVECHHMSYFLSCTSQEQVSQEMYHNLYGRFIGMVVQMTQ